MDFKLDENLPVEVAELLVQAGHTATTVIDEGLGGRPDADVATVAQREQRVVVTLDVGFADVRTYPPRQHAGLIVLRLRRQDKASVLAAVSRLVPALAAEALVGRLWIVEETRIRARD